MGTHIIFLWILPPRGKCEILIYHTPPLVAPFASLAEVVIQDKRLGVMKYALMLAIAIFILLYQLLYMNHYLLTQEPTGTVR